MKTRIILICLSVVGLIALTGCDSSKPKAQSGEAVESLTVGLDRTDLSALIWVAKARGYFSEQYLDVKLKLHDSGLSATEDLLAGNSDLAACSEFVAGRKILDRPDLRILTSLDESVEIKLVARKDRGIIQIADIRNKRIGLVFNATGQYYLNLLMVLNNIPPQEVQMVNLTAPEQVKAIVKGDIDSMIVWEPFATMAKNELGSNGIIWSGQSGYGFYWLLVGTAEIVKNRPSAVRRFVAALASAEEFIKDHTDEAERLVASELGPNHSSWKEHHFGLGLDRSLIISMEEQIKWMDPRVESSESKMPDFLDFIHVDSLKSVNPEKVKIIY